MNNFFRRLYAFTDRFFPVPMAELEARIAVRNTMAIHDQLSSEGKKLFREIVRKAL